MDDLNIQAGVTVNAEQAESAFTNLGDKAQKMANEVTKAADKAGKATDGMGDGAEKSADKFTRAESRMRSAIQKSTRELEMLGKTASQKFEAQLEFKGLDKAKFQPFLAELRKTEEAAAKAQAGVSGIGDAAKVAGSMMAAAFSGAALLGAVGKVVSVQREFDVLNSSLKTVTGSSAAAEREMAWLKDFAKETPFGLAQATQGFVKMKALGLDPTRAALTSFGNTASAMGKDLNQMIEAVADASTGEFERLKEFGIKAKKEGDNVSLTFQGVTKTIGNSAREITKYLEDIGNTSFGGAMEERAKTLDGTIAALGDTWDELFRTVSTNNVGGLIFDSVTLANGALEDATTILRALGGAAQDAGRDTGALSTIQSGIATVFETVAVLGANLKFVLVGIGNEIGGLAAQVAQAAQFNFSGVAAIRRQMVADAEAARKEIDATTARILNARKAQEEYARYATRNASAATDPRRVDLGGSAPRATGGVSSGTAKAVKETISEYDKLIKKLSEELPKAAAEAEAAQMGYNKAQTEFLALAGSDVWAKFSNSERARVAAVYEGKIASEEAGEAAKALSKSYAEAAAERIKTIQSMERAADSLQSQNDALREEIELIGLSTEQQTLVLQQRNDVIILTKEATLAELERQSAITGTQTRVEIALASEIAALKERNALLGAKGVKNAAVDAAKSAADEWQKTSDKINDTLTDALMRGFESGKDFAENLRQTVVNMFKTMVLRPVISVIVNPVAGAVTGMMGLSGAAQAGQGMSAMGAAGNLFSAGSALGGLGAVGGAMSGFTTAATASIQSLIGMSGTVAQMTTSLAAAGHTAAAGVSAGVQAFQAIPGWGWALAGVAAVAALWDDDSGTLHTGGAAQYSAATGLRTSLDFRDNEEGLPSYNPNDNIDNQFGTGFGWSARSDQTISAVSGIAQGLSATLDGVAVAFGETAGYAVATAFADDTSKDGAWGALRISKDGQELLNWEDTRQSKWAPREFGDGEEGYKQYLAAVAKDTRQVLLDMDLPSWADTMLESIGDAANMDQLAATVQQIGVIQTTFVQLGKTMEGFAGLTDQAFEALMRASGGLESLAANAGTYYENFYSEAEKTAAVTRSVSESLAQVGLTMPATRDEFRALVESQLSMGEAGAEAVAALLGVSGAFASVTAAAVDASEAARQLAEEQARAAKAAQDAAYSDFRRAVDRDRSVLQDQASILADAIGSIADAVSMLKSNARELYGTVDSTSQMLAAQGMVYIENALAGVRAGGSVADYTGLGDAIGAARGGIDSGTYATQFERDRDALVLAGQLSELGTLGDLQLSIEERQLRAINSQLEYLDTLSQRAEDMVNGTTALTETVDTYFTRLMGILDPEKTEDTPGKPGGKSQYSGTGVPTGKYGQGYEKDPVRFQEEFNYGYGRSFKDVEDADQTAKLTNLRSMLQAEYGSGTPEDLARIASLAKSSGASMADIGSALGFWESDIRKIFEGAGIPAFAVGTNYVPRDMVAKIHEGEAIVPKAYNPWANGQAMQGGDPELLAEMRAMRAELAALRAAASATANNTAAMPQMADQFDTVTNGGNAMRAKALA